MINKKIRNASPVEIDGIKFRSKLEKFTYEILKTSGIKAQYEPKAYILLEAFEFDGKKVRAMTYTPDFVGKNFIIECKGFKNDVFPIKEKLFKHYLSKNEPNVKFYIGKNQTEIKQIIEQIKIAA